VVSDRWFLILPHQIALLPFSFSSTDNSVKSCCYTNSATNRIQTVRIQTVRSFCCSSTDTGQAKFTD
ncbi:hypothetical protein, partial [uncultured Nostoc sp.]|uniref:hypothetical protein n=1 Tax=uncultured Nostoc sp. TaxID=340711 RepID=UPI0035C94563